MAKPLEVYNRKAGRLELESVYGSAWLHWAYETALGRVALAALTRPLFSRVYGAFQSSRLSALKVPGFVRRYGIALEEFGGAPYGSFNAFFSRPFKPGARSFAKGSDFPAFAEARYFAFEDVREEQVFPIKGEGLSASLVLGGAELARPFLGGPVLLARLCPVDYHRFHYPDAGRTIERYDLEGPLHSVNPVALAFDGTILARNQRRVSLLKTERFGLLAYVEVGALCVGKIVQTHPDNAPFKRGDEKGYFLFGGSTVIVFGQKGAWRPDADLLGRTASGSETLVRLGEKIGARA